MSEIEKMYENVGIEKCNSTLKYIIPNICLKECEEETYKCKDCEHFEYPPFTAEKQIEILKLFTNQCDLTISHFMEWEFIHYDGQEPTQVTGEDFVETFSKLINAYWQSLAEEEKQQIRDILK